MRLEIIKEKVSGYTIMIDNSFFRHCKTYSELTSTINSLIRAGFKDNAEGFI